MKGMTAVAAAAVSAALKGKLTQQQQTREEHVPKSLAVKLRVDLKPFSGDKK